MSQDLHLLTLSLPPKAFFLASMTPTFLACLLLCVCLFWVSFERLSSIQPLTVCQGLASSSPLLPPQALPKGLSNPTSVSFTGSKRLKLSLRTETHLFPLPGIHRCSFATSIWMSYKHLQPYISKMNLWFLPFPSLSLFKGPHHLPYGLN